jgi:hypothetical protein
VEGFQTGFKPSTARISLLSISATELEVSLTRIDGGDAGMIEVLKKLDPVCCENDIPFSRLYGSNIFLRTGNLAVQLRNYTFPLFAATSGKCEGCVVLAQQVTLKVAFHPPLLPYSTMLQVFFSSLCSFTLSGLSIIILKEQWK